MSCNRETINITAGTDVILNVTLEHDGIVLNPALIDNLQTNLVTGLGKRTPLEVTPSADYLVVNIPWVDGRIPGYYSLEITGSINGLAWSTVGKSIIRYTSATEIGPGTVDVTGDGYDVTMEVGYYYTDSPIEGVSATIDDGVGEPSVEISYIHKQLSFDFHNLRGNGITSIETDEQQGDEAINTVTIKTDLDDEGTDFHVRNGSRGNGITSSSETLSPDDGGVNTHIFTDDDGGVHEFHTTNGRTGKQGDSAVFDPSTGNISAIKQTTGDDRNSPMSQKAVTEAVDDVKTVYHNVFSNADLEITDDYNNALARFSEGHIQTKNFDSREAVSAETSDIQQDLGIIDEEGHVIASLYDGHIKTKNFNSKFFSSRVAGKRISIIGDSISSYNGWVPKNGVNGYNYATYPAYYPRETVTSVSQTWWHKVISDLSLIIGQNCSWSGSMTNGNGEATDTAYAGCSDRRVADLSLNGIPDIIVIYMGTNDFTTKDDINIPIGNLTSKDLLPENGVKSTFSEAYGLMLSKVMQSYPLAQVFCCSLLDTNHQYRDKDGVYPTRNKWGVYLEDYNAKIKELALGYGAHFVDLNNCGITWFNLAQMMVDGSLHPNEQGHTLIANMVKKEILRYF